MASVLPAGGGVRGARRRFERALRRPLSQAASLGDGWRTREIQIGILKSLDISCAFDLVFMRVKGERATPPRVLQGSLRSPAIVLARGARLAVRPRSLVEGGGFRDGSPRTEALRAWPETPRRRLAPRLRQDSLPRIAPETKRFGGVGARGSTRRSPRKRARRLGSGAEGRSCRIREAGPVRLFRGIPDAIRKRTGTNLEARPLHRGRLLDRLHPAGPDLAAGCAFKGAGAGRGGASPGGHGRRPFPVRCAGGLGPGRSGRPGRADRAPPSGLPGRRPRQGEAFRRAALAPGGRDNGAPGLRASPPGSHAVFGLDRDGSRRRGGASRRSAAFGADRRLLRHGSARGASLSRKPAGCAAGPCPGPRFGPRPSATSESLPRCATRPPPFLRPFGSPPCPTCGILGELP